MINTVGSLLRTWWSVWCTIGFLFAAHVWAAQAPQRIASGTVASDEILFELLSRSKQMHRLVGLSSIVDDGRFSNIVPQAKIIPGRVGGELEALLRLKPDLVVLASFNRPEFIAQVEKASGAVYRLEGFSSLNDIALHMEKLGARIKEETTGKQLAKEFREKIAALQATALAKKKLRGGKALKVLNWHGDGIFLGSDTVFNSMMLALACENMAASVGIKGWGRLNDEVLATMEVDWLIVAGEESERARVLQALQGKKAFSKLAAVKNKHLIMVPTAELSALSHHVLRAMEKIVAFL